MLPLEFRSGKKKVVIALLLEIILVVLVLLNYRHFITIWNCLFIDQKEDNLRDFHVSSLKTPSLRAETFC